jgi:transcriptional regulator with GAF, ATPase, and Fis domain
MERQTIENALRQTDWNKAKAARRLGLTRTQLYVRLRRYGIENADAM